jgi:hypothetical protein
MGELSFSHDACALKVSTENMSVYVSASLRGMKRMLVLKIDAPQSCPRGNHKRKLLMQLFNSYAVDGKLLLCWSCVCEFAKSLRAFEEWRLLVQA